TQGYISDFDKRRIGIHTVVAIVRPPIDVMRMCCIFVASTAGTPGRGRFSGCVCTPSIPVIPHNIGRYVVVEPNLRSASLIVLRTEFFQKTVGHKYPLSGEEIE